MDPVELEQMTGTRSNYQAFPNSQPQLESLYVPLAIHFTPNKRIDQMYTSFDQPIKCSCGGYFNPYSNINYQTKSWFCNFCSKNNKFTQAEIGRFPPQGPPTEALQENITMEYKLSDNKSKTSSAFNHYVFVVDTCMSPDNLTALQKELTEACEQFDFDQTRVAVISFSRNVFFHRRIIEGGLAHSLMAPSYFNTEQLHNLLGVKPDSKNRAMVGHIISEMLFQSSKEGLVSVIDGLECDYWNTPDTERPQRATGKAMEFALEILSLASLDCGRLTLFVAGPCTLGQGSIVELKISSFLRQHLDLEENKEIKAKSDAAKAFYTALSDKAVSMNIAIDIFGFSLTEFGLYEMRDLPTKTGGIIVLNEEFKQEHFVRAITKYLSKDDQGQPLMNTMGHLEVIVSKELRISGCIGNCKTLSSKPANLSDVQIGESNTNTWHLGGLDPQTSILLFFDITEKNKAKGYPHGQTATIQFIVTYRHSTQGMMRRVVTLQKPFVNYQKPIEMIEYIDQFSVISSYAKIAAFKTLDSDSSIVIRYLDKTLIGIMRIFKQSNQIPDQLSLLPQYFYYLRKSNFIKKFASSLDEMTFFKHVVMRETLDNTLIIVQPQIIEYSLNNPEPVPVLPDIDCLKKDVVLLADTFFNLIIWKGNTIKSWIDAGYHTQPEYEHLARLIQMPEDDIQFICEDRVLAPNKIYSNFGSPSERFLKSRLNPENKQLTKDNEAIESGNFVSEDASLSNFMSKLLQVVNSNN